MKPGTTTRINSPCCKLGVQAHQSGSDTNSVGVDLSASFFKYSHGKLVDASCIKRPVVLLRMSSSCLELKLHSPAGSEPAIFQWPLPTGTSVSNLLICEMSSFILQMIVLLEDRDIVPKYIKIFQGPVS